MKCIKLQKSFDISSLKWRELISREICSPDDFRRLKFWNLQRGRTYIERLLYIEIVLITFLIKLVLRDSTVICHRFVPLVFFAKCKRLLWFLLWCTSNFKPLQLIKNRNLELCQKGEQIILCQVCQQVF